VIAAPNAAPPPAGTDPPGSAYERFAYPGFAYAATHPARLEIIGLLFGLSPAPAAGARVLELGCGDGGNLLSMAQSLPGATFVGIDASAAAVSRGSELARAAGLENVDLRVGELERLPADLNGFDYAIAHGVYSWVAPPARAALLACCRRSLTADGIAYVSYNAYPGSYLRDMTRDILRYHVRDVQDPKAQLERAHGLMQTIVAIEEPSPLARVLRDQIERMLQASDALLFHDDLAEISTPFYFHEFVEHAAGHGLAFLSEADLSEGLMRGLPAEAERVIATLPDDPLVHEQYIDFFKNRMFRQTLLCHVEAPVRRTLDDDLLERLTLSCAARPSTDPGASGEQTFVTAEGYSVTTSEPLVLAALHTLSELWPATLRFDDLVERSRPAVDPQLPVEAVATRLRAVMLEAYVTRIVRLHRTPPPAGPNAGERPYASPLARAQRAAGADVVSSLLHANVRLDGDVDAALLPLLDGTRDRPALCRELALHESELDAALLRFSRAGLLSA
jgi:SAM-dependent methyltransferase